MRARWIFPWLLAVSLCGCFGASERDDGSPTRMAGSDASTPPAPPEVPPDPPPGVTPIDISRCDDAPVLPLDGMTRGIAPNVLPRVDGSCWTGEGALGYLRLSLPPRTGVEIVTRGVDPPGLSIADRCAPSAGSNCRNFPGTGIFDRDAVSRTYYVGNSSSETWSLAMAVRWGDGSPRTAFDVETRSVPLPPESACESARVLAPGELAPGGAGGFFDACGGAHTGRFYRISIPAMSRAVALDGSDPFLQMSSCACSSDDEGPFQPTLENLSDAPTEAVLFGQMSVGFAIEPMPPSARCESASPLALDGTPSFFDMGLAGAPTIACDARFSEGGHFARVEIPAGTSVRVSAVFPPLWPEHGTVLWARTSCATDECAAVVNTYGTTSTDIVLVAPAHSPGSWVVGIAMTASFRDRTASLSASLVL